MRLRRQAFNLGMMFGQILRRLDGPAGTKIGLASIFIGGR
jgi:hypothetical protein